jgi:hypothetical protein
MKKIRCIFRPVQPGRHPSHIFVSEQPTIRIVEAEFPDGRRGNHPPPPQSKRQTSISWKKNIVKESHAQLLFVEVCSPNPCPTVCLSKAGAIGYTERRKTRVEVRKMDIPAVIAGGWGGGEFI